jgi:hypothetical protein
MGDDIGQRAPPDSTFDGAAPLGQQRRTSPTARVIVERETLNQQASTS